MIKNIILSLTASAVILSSSLFASSALAQAEVPLVEEAGTAAAPTQQAEHPAKTKAHKKGHKKAGAKKAKKQHHNKKNKAHAN